MRSLFPYVVSFLWAWNLITDSVLNLLCSLISKGDIALSLQSKKRNVLDRLPPTFREQYFSLFGAPEPETIHPTLYQKLIDNGTDVILNQLKKYNEQRRELAKTIHA